MEIQETVLGVEVIAPYIQVQIADDRIVINKAETLDEYRRFKGQGNIIAELRRQKSTTAVCIVQSVSVPVNKAGGTIYMMDKKEVVIYYDPLSNYVNVYPKVKPLTGFRLHRTRGRLIYTVLETR